MRSSNRTGSFFVFIVLLGAISGSFIGEVLGNNINALKFLKIVYPIGTSNPLVLNLKVVELTFGINFNLNFMAVIGIILAVLFHRKY